MIGSVEVDRPEQLGRFFLPQAGWPCPLLQKWLLTLHVQGEAIGVC